MLVAENVRFRYPASTHLAVDGANCSVEPGEIVALMGASGSGKTTLARLLSGALVPINGHISVDGCRLHASADPESFRGKIGLLQSEPDSQLIGETVVDELAFGLSNYRIDPRIITQRVSATLQQAGMEDYANYPPRFLSGGQKQKLLILAFGLLETDYLVLDEPFQMLDNQEKAMIAALLQDLARQKNQGIIFSTHHIEEALDIADRIMLMQDGRIIECRPTLEMASQTEQLVRAGVRPPQIAVLASMLETHGLAAAEAVVRPDQLAEVIWRSWFKA